MASTTRAIRGIRRSVPGPPRTWRWKACMRAERGVLAALALLLGACGGGGGGAGSAAAPCSANCDAAAGALAVADVQLAIAQAAGEAKARGRGAVIAVVDRVGNVLAVYQFGD